LRLAVAFLLTGSANWQVTPDGTPPHHDTIGASVRDSAAHRDWQQHRATMQTLVGRDTDSDAEKPLLHREWGEHPTAEVLARLLTLTDGEVLQVLAAAVAESLPANGGLLEVIGTLLRVDLRPHWTPDATFFALLRDKDALKRMLSEVGRDPPAKATTAELRATLQRRLDGQDGRPITDWLPRYLAFPPGR
jgi:ParB family chromosome partitioning protein